MEIKQRHVIKFVADERMPGVEIIFHLRNQYGEDILSRMQVYSWIHGLRLGRADFGTTASPRREPDEDLSIVIARKQRK
jgi:hypothetical protein